MPREYAEACFRVMRGLIVCLQQLRDIEERQRTVEEQQRTVIQHKRDTIAMLMAAVEEVECEDDEDSCVIDASPPAEGPSRDT